VAPKKLSQLELRVMEVLWTRGPSSVREVQEQLPEATRPAYTTVQTLMYRLEGKKAVRRSGKSGNALIFEPTVSKISDQRHLIDQLLGLLGGKAQPLVAYLIDTGKLTLDDVHEAEQRLLELSRKTDEP